MATDQTRTVDDAPDDPADLLPEESVLDLDEYLDMHAAVGHRTRYEILYRLVHRNEMSPKELEDALEIDDSTLHYHLNKLVDVGLVEKRQRTERGQDGLYTYYRATVFGEVTLTDGVDELIRGEQSFEAMYNSSSKKREIQASNALNSTNSFKRVSKRIGQ
ncbi:ArsR family transcriptional regulator [Halanaeroarchaeum sulfurireducens]|uniref:ArsR family transcriptional regulator n=1 Tax=Halanaeroarchaeum sulfurireducens TaxID=1604004 RepID=A0A0F7PDP1_9EURY|nr:ArsR family transcriptional regulator [Halanaeroarchaeum sulfurireducens]ALG81849.1 ArsR family transcriptional regulator [Halanaeroarchaeum sulfurireducens]